MKLQDVLDHVNFVTGRWQFRQQYVGPAKRRIRESRQVGYNQPRVADVFRLSQGGQLGKKLCNVLQGFLWKGEGSLVGGLLAEREELEVAASIVEVVDGVHVAAATAGFVRLQLRARPEGQGAPMNSFMVFKL